MKIINKIKGVFSINLVIISFLLHCVNLDAATQTHNTVEGTIINIPSDSTGNINLYSYYGSKLSLIETAPLYEKGNFKFRLSKTLQTGLYNLGFEPVNSATIVLSNNEKEVTLKADFRDLQVDKVTVNNSWENDADKAVREEVIRFNGRFGNLNSLELQISPVDPFSTRKVQEIKNKKILLIKEHNNHLTLIKESYPETFVADVLINLSLIPLLHDHPEFKDNYDNDPAFMHDHFFDFVDFTDQRVINGPLLIQKYNTYLNDYTHHIQEGFKASADVLLDKSRVNNTVLEFTIQYLIDIFHDNGPEGLVDYVVDNVDKYMEGCSSPLSEITVDRLQGIKRLRVGQLAPDITANGTDENLVALSSLIGKKAVMLYFWASWCSYCEDENPELVRIYIKFKDKGFEVYAIALDHDKAEWLSSIENHHLTWINVSDLTGWESECARIYNIHATPTTYLLDKEGRIVAKNFKGDELEPMLEEILN